ncbi:MAG: insulinase family protein [Pseudoflavonifractor sp.]
MTNLTQRDLMPGVQLTAVHTSKFKSSYLGLTLLVPLDRAQVSANALVPAVLRQGTERYPNMEALSAALDELCGGSIEPMVRKKGETQCLGFVASFLDDAYSPDGSPILEPAAALLGELLLHPATENGGFRREYVERERANLEDKIGAQLSDKRQYALLRLIETMCRGEAYGIDRLGRAEEVAALTGEALWARYQDLLATAQVELYYCGSADFGRVEAAMGAALKGLPRAEDQVMPDCEVRGNRDRDQPYFYEDKLDVTQGKLTMGFRTDGACIWSDDYPALMLLSAIFGGTTTSKLFLNVRERLSLCYYASAQLEKLKGLLLVSSGVEFDKRQQAQDEILAQLEACKRGEFEPWELEAARRSTISSLATLTDSQGRQEDYWLGLAVAGLNETPEALAARLETVTAEQVAAVAKRLELDTVYFLNGKEAASDGEA